MDLQNQNYGANKQSDLFKDLILMYVVAKSGSGKSHLISSLIQNDKYGLNKRFLGDQIYLFSPTQTIDDSQIKTRDFIKNMKTNEGYKFDEEAQFFQTNIITAIQNLYDQQIDIKKSDQALKTKKSRELLFIIDDCMGSKYLDTRQNSQFEQLMVKIRHANIHVIMICQEYKRGASPVIRAQFNMIILFYLPNYGDQKKIVEELSGNNKKKFESVYQDATKDRFQSLLVMQDFPLLYKYFKIEDAIMNIIQIYIFFLIYKMTQFSEDTYQAFLQRQFMPKEALDNNYKRIYGHIQSELISQQVMSLNKLTDERNRIDDPYIKQQLQKRIDVITQKIKDKQIDYASSVQNIIVKQNENIVFQNVDLYQQNT